MNNEISTNSMESSRIIDNINVSELSNIMNKIVQFQELIQKNLKQDLDYGIIPNTKKPSLLKAGAEKIIMLLGLRSEFEIINQSRDFENGFFQYQIKCKLYHGNSLVTEGLGACNTRETRYRNHDGFNIDNTVLKMAKKRAMVDSALMVGSLSDIFTQDIEDIDLNGNKVSNSQQKNADEDIRKISIPQSKRLFAISKGDIEILNYVLSKYNYEKSEDIKKMDYENICNEIYELVNEKIQRQMEEDRQMYG